MRYDEDLLADTPFCRTRWLSILCAVVGVLFFVLTGGPMLSVLLVTLLASIGIAIGRRPIPWLVVGVVGSVLVLMMTFGTRGVVDFHTY